MYGEGDECVAGGTGSELWFEVEKLCCIMWAFIAFNVVGAIFLYWWVRVPKKEQDEPIVVVDEEKEGSDSTVLTGVGSAEPTQNAPVAASEKTERPIDGQHEIRAEPSQATLVDDEEGKHVK